MIERLAEGSLSLAEVEPLTEKARELYERLIALRYAAMQTLVKGVEEEQSAPAEPTVPFRLNQVLPGQTSLIDAIEEVTAVESVETSKDDADTQPEAVVHTVEEAADELIVDEHPSTPTANEEEDNFSEEAIEEPVAIAAEPEVENTVAAEPAMAPEPPRMPPVAGRVLPKEKNAENTVAARLRRTPIEDLRKAIGLNQKFQFINDVFKGDSTAYNLIIDEVNSAASFEHAMIILSSANARFEHVDEEDTVVLALIQLVERRFL